MEVLVVGDDRGSAALVREFHELVVVRVVGDDAGAARGVDRLGLADPLADDSLALAGADCFGKNVAIFSENRFAHEQSCAALGDGLEKLSAGRIGSADGGDEDIRIDDKARWSLRAIVVGGGRRFVDRIATQKRGCLVPP